MPPDRELRPRATPSRGSGAVDLTLSRPPKWVLGEQVFAPILTAMARGTSSNEATIRMLNLLALLTEAKAPLTIEQIANEMSSLEPQYRYPTNPSARRTTFNRDKAALVKMGIPIITSTLSGQDAGVGAYIVDKQAYALIDFGLTPEELDALQAAAAVVQIEKPWGRSAVQWLGGAVEEPPTSAVAHLSTSSPVLVAVWSAVTNRAEITFDYHGRSRTLRPYGVINRNGFWYLVGFDTGYEEQRTYRVDRIEGAVVAGDAGTFVRPDGFDIESSVPTDPKSFGNGASEHAVVRVDANLAAGVIAELGQDAVVGENKDTGQVDVRVACGNFDAFRVWLFAMVDRAEVISPEPVRSRIVNELLSMGGAK